MKKKLVPSKLFIQLALTLFSTNVFATNIFWNVASGDWTTAANWNPASVPGTSDIAFIGNGGQANLAGFGDNGNTNEVFVAGSSTLSITGGGFLAANAVSVAQSSGLVTGSGTLIIDGSGGPGPSPSGLITPLFETNAIGSSNAFQANVTVSHGAILSAQNILINDTPGSTVFNVLSGGIVTTGQITTPSSTMPASFTFDSATLLPTNTQPDFISGFTGPQTFTINAGGLTIDTGSFGVDIGIGSDFPGFIGVGALTKAGTNTLTMSANNSYTGNTVISGGTLQLGSGGTTGSVAGNIVDNAALVFDRSDIYTYGGLISGSGTLTQAGSGTLVLTNNNTYAGTTTISSGTLQLGDGGATGSLQSSNIVDNAALVFDVSSNKTYAGNITGTGSLTQAGSGTTTLTGTNTYGGGTTISGGTLQLGNGGATGSIVGNVLDNTALIFDTSGTQTYGGVISGVGSVTRAGTGTTILTGTNAYTGGTTILSGGTLQLGNGGATGTVVGNITDNGALVVDLSSTYTYNNVISGTGTLTQEGSGTLILNGTNTYLGLTTITGGNLELGDGFHPLAKISGNVLVDPGGTLSGTGTIGGNLTNSGGIVSPGGTIGTLMVLGNYAQSSAGSYMVQVDQSGNSDLLQITGTASLNGTVGINAVNNGFLVNFPYTILTSGGGVTGTFSNTNIAGIFNQGFLQGKVLYFPNKVEFLVGYNAALFMQDAITPNQQAVAGSILATGGTSQIQALIASLTTAEQFQSAMDQLSGATFANQEVAIARVGNWFSGELADRFDAFPSLNCNGSLMAPQRGTDQKNQFWFADHGAEENISSGQVSGLKTDTGNFALGYEFGVGETGKVGVGAAYSTFSSRAQTREMGRAQGSLYQAGLYGRVQMGQWLFGVAFDAGVTGDVDTQRRIQGAMNVATTAGSYKAHLYSEQARVGYDLTPTSPSRFSPYVGIIGQQLSRNSFAETTQTGFDLNVSDSTYTSTRSQVGALFEMPMAGALKPFVSADWEHEFGNQYATFNANFVGLGSPFNIRGQSIGRDSALVKAGTVIACGRNWNVAVLYQGWYGSGWQENGGTVEASMAFG